MKWNEKKLCSVPKWFTFQFRMSSKATHTVLKTFMYRLFWTNTCLLVGVYYYSFTCYVRWLKKALEGAVEDGPHPGLSEAELPRDPRLWELRTIPTERGEVLVCVRWFDAGCCLQMALQPRHSAAPRITSHPRWVNVLVYVDDIIDVELTDCWIKVIPV